MSFFITQTGTAEVKALIVIAIACVVGLLIALIGGLRG